MRHMHSIVTAALCLSASALAAQGTPSATSDLSVGLSVGTLGIGLQVSKLLEDHLGVRIGGNYYSLNTTQTQSDITYVATAKLQAFTGLLDYYPAARGAFHLTAGIITNPLSFSGVGQPNPSGNITINHVQYPASEVGTVNASIKWPGASPYLGLGFGTPAGSSGSWGLVFDLGVGIGKPKVQLSTTGSAPGLAANLAAQQDSTQAKANKLGVYPAITLGLVHRF